MNSRFALYTTFISLMCATFIVGCADTRTSMDVVATAYTSHAGQTDSQPSIAAWGDTLEPGMQAIAVSRDLLKLGLQRGVEVEIDGLPGTWIVLDKMHARWEKKIDIYMGLDTQAAREWGKQTVTIRWQQ